MFLAGFGDDSGPWMFFGELLKVWGRQRLLSPPWGLTQWQLLVVVKLQTESFVHKKSLYFAE